MFTLGTLASSSDSSLPLGGYWIGYHSLYGDSRSILDSSGSIYTAIRDFSTIFVIKQLYSGEVLWSTTVDLGIYVSSYGFWEVSVSISSTNLYVSYPVFDGGDSYFVVVNSFSIFDGSEENSKKYYGNGEYFLSSAWDGSNLYLAGSCETSSLGSQSEFMYTSSNLSTTYTRTLATSNAANLEKVGSISVDSSYYYLSGRHGSDQAYFGRFSKSNHSVNYLRSLDLGFVAVKSIIVGSYWYILGQIDTNTRRIIRFSSSSASSSSTQVDLPSGIYPNDIASDSSGNIYFLGWDFVNQKGVLFKFDSNLDLVWQRQMYLQGYSGTFKPFSISTIGGIMNISFSADYKNFITILPVDGSYTGTYTILDSAVVYSESSYVFPSDPPSITTSSLTKSSSSVTRSSTYLSLASSNFDSFYDQVDF